MKAVLDVAGWRKVETIPDHHLITGSITLGVIDPISRMVQPDTPVVGGYKSVKFYLTNKEVNRMPLFRAEEY
jgi:hypothetical protein